MKNIQLSDYKTIQQAISMDDPVSSAAELQGLLCGLICAGSAKLPTHYQESALMKNLYATLSEQFSHALDQETFTLNLLLPDDEQPLALRTQALGEWAQGFMAGLGEGGFQLSRSTPDVQEVLEDFQSIAQIQGGDAVNADDISEEDEKAFVEVLEYMRMAVLSLYTDLVIANNIESQSDTEH